MYLVHRYIVTLVQSNHHKVYCSMMTSLVLYLLFVYDDELTGTQWLGPDSGLDGRTPQVVGLCGDLKLVLNTRPTAGSHLFNGFQ